ncbi:hypothetical protein TGVAND_320715 [Toxoplasma gondii VAND]|uniref:Uncharacterized protein n=1 Tax=Toxoplasma gondii VAND TaxID=933077 RepID=A0A086PTY3_TOXGO|nr:hypothetical protein TGVAND_320715 [Toxoplasma gondii VAND]
MSYICCLSSHVKPEKATFGSCKRTQDRSSTTRLNRYRMPTCSRQMNVASHELQTVADSLSHPGALTRAAGGNCASEELASKYAGSHSSWALSLQEKASSSETISPKEPLKNCRKTRHFSPWSGHHVKSDATGGRVSASSRPSFEKAFENKEWIRLFRSRLDCLLRHNRQHDQRKRPSSVSSTKSTSRQNSEETEPVGPASVSTNIQPCNDNAYNSVHMDKDGFGLGGGERTEDHDTSEGKRCYPGIPVFRGGEGELLQKQRSFFSTSGVPLAPPHTCNRENLPEYEMVTVESLEMQPVAFNKDKEARPLHLQLQGRLCIPPLFKAAALFRVDTNVQLHQQFLGVEENDIVLQRLLTNYFVHRLSSKLQQVSLTLKMIPPHLPLFLGPENKPALRLSKLTGVQILLIGASIGESQRNTRYIVEPAAAAQSARRSAAAQLFPKENEFRQVELRGHIDAVLAAYAHLAYRLQHPLRKAVAFCVLVALKQGREGARRKRESSGVGIKTKIRPLNTEETGNDYKVDQSPQEDRVRKTSVGGSSHPSPDCSMPVGPESSCEDKLIDLVSKLLSMPPVACESPAIVRGVAVESAPTSPLCIPQIARDEAWVLPLP